MKIPNGSIRTKIFFTLATLVLAGLVGTGGVLAYKKVKLSQAQTNSPAVQSAAVASWSPGVKKTIINSDTKEAIGDTIKKGDKMDIDITIDGAKDRGGILPKKADIMIVMRADGSYEDKLADNSGNPSIWEYKLNFQTAYSLAEYAKNNIGYDWRIGISLSRNAEHDCAGKGLQCDEAKGQNFLHLNSVLNNDFKTICTYFWGTSDNNDTGMCQSLDLWKGKEFKGIINRDYARQGEDGMGVAWKDAAHELVENPRDGAQKWIIFMSKPIGLWGDYNGYRIRGRCAMNIDDNGSCDNKAGRASDFSNEMFPQFAYIQFMRHIRGSNCALTWTGPYNPPPFDNDGDRSPYVGPASNPDTSAQQYNLQNGVKVLTLSNVNRQPKLVSPGSTGNMGYFGVHETDVHDDQGLCKSYDTKYDNFTNCESIEDRENYNQCCNQRDPNLSVHTEFPSGNPAACFPNYNASADWRYTYVDRLSREAAVDPSLFNVDDPIVGVRNMANPNWPGDDANVYNPFTQIANTIDEYQYSVEAMADAINGAGNKTFGAPIHISEVLPPGATVKASDVSVERYPDNKILNPNLINLVVENGADGRVKITFSLNETHYKPGLNPKTQKFILKIHNVTTAGISTACFDTDQSCDTNGMESAASPSYVTWSFPKSGAFGGQYKRIMPCREICFGTQYSGDIYGATIGTYAFPGMDVAVGGLGGNSSTGAVWSLSRYSFSDSSYSDYGTFRDKLNNKIIPDLKGRAEVIYQIDPIRLADILHNPNPNKDTYPEGMVYYLKGQTRTDISSQTLTIGSVANQQQRATIIIDGDLYINGPTRITKPRNVASNNVLLIVNGDVIIGDEVQQLDLGILAANQAPKGIIRITNSNNPLRIKGFLIGRDVNLRPNSPQSQRINFDPTFALYPPPGLSNIDLPIFKEGKP